MSKSVLVVDDDRMVRKLIARILGDDYNVLLAEDGTEGLQKAVDDSPDFILLDVEMPGLNGYEVCDQIKHNEATADIPVLFLSSHTGLRERMLGYEMGAADFLTKPFEADELKAKLGILSEYVTSREELGEKAKVASETAFTAMRGSSELGLAIQFIGLSYNAKSLDKLAEKFLSVTSSLGLNCTLLFRTEAGNQFHSSKGSHSPLEEEVMEKLLFSGNRFNDFGCRTQINYHRVALLVKNMPLEDAATYGRFKDFLPTMMAVTDEKIKALETEAALAKQTQHLVSSFEAVRTTLSQVGTDLQETQHRVLGLLRSTIDELDTRIPTLGLEDDQEKYLINTLDRAINSTHGIIDSGENASASFTTVIKLLDHLAERQQKLLEVSSYDTEAPAQEFDDSAATGDVELF